MIRLILILVLMGVLQAQTGVVSPNTVADITCDGSAHAIQTSGTARWVQIITFSTNSAIVRIGDSNVGSSRGLPIAAGGGYLFAPIPADSREAVVEHLYRLSSIYYYCTASDKLAVLW